jgi:hypothetical protein
MMTTFLLTAWVAVLAASFCIAVWLLKKLDLY